MSAPDYEARKETLLATLRDLADPVQTQAMKMGEPHQRADYALLAFIDEPEVTEAFMAIRRYYV